MHRRNSPTSVGLFCFFNICVLKKYLLLQYKNNNMATNVSEMTDRLMDLGILGDIRQRLGAKDEHDTSFDKQIDSMTADEIMAEWSAWKLGSAEWWKDMNRKYNRLMSDF